MSEMRILVCGGRDYMDVDHVFSTLDALWKELQFAHVIEGGQWGADTLAKRWAEANPNKVGHTQYGANWKLYGPGAGPIRNRRMIYEGKPTLIVAFPGGAGTRNLVMQAREAGIKVVEVKRPE